MTRGARNQAIHVPAWAIAADKRSLCEGTDDDGTGASAYVSETPYGDMRISRRSPPTNFSDREPTETGRAAATVRGWKQTIRSGLRRPRSWRPRPCERETHRLARRIVEDCGLVVLRRASRRAPWNAREGRRRAAPCSMAASAMSSRSKSRRSPTRAKAIRGACGPVEIEVGREDGARPFVARPPERLAVALQEHVRLRHDRQRRRVTRSSVAGERPSVVEGGHWGPVRTRCRRSTKAHGEDHLFYRYRRGFRCCADPRPAQP